MNENYNPQKKWEKKLQDRETRYNQILLLLRNDKKELAKRKNHKHLFEIIRKQNIKEGDRITIDYYDEEHPGEELGVMEETGELVEFTGDEVVLSGIEPDFDITIPIETISDIYHVNQPNY